MGIRGGDREGRGPEEAGELSVRPGLFALEGVKSVLAVDEVVDPAMLASDDALRGLDGLVSDEGVQGLEFGIGIGKGTLLEGDDPLAAVLADKRQDMLIEVEAIQKEAPPLAGLGEGGSQPWEEPIEGLEFVPLQRDLCWPSVFWRKSVPREIARPFAHTSFASRAG